MTEDNNSKKGRKTINLRETEFLRKLASNKPTPVIANKKPIIDVSEMDKVAMERFIDAFNAEMLVQSKMIIPMHVWLGCTPAEFVTWKKTRKWPTSRV